MHVKDLEQCLVHPHFLIRVTITTSITLTNTRKLLLIKSLWIDAGGRMWGKVLVN